MAESGLLGELKTKWWKWTEEGDEPCDKVSIKQVNRMELSAFEFSVD